MPGCETYFMVVSTTDQHAERQITAARKYRSALKTENIFIDKMSGKTFDMSGWNILKRIIRSGDELIISELDRLGRTKQGIKETLEFISSKGVRIRCLDVPTTLQDIEGQDWVLI